MLRLLRLWPALLLLASTALAVGMPQTLTPVPERPPAPDFALKDVDGGVHRLADLRGKVVIINFWATWCPPCRDEMPSMQRAWEALQGKEVVMLAVNVGENADTVFQFTANYPVEFPLLLDESGKATEAWPVRGLPSTFVVDPQGRIVYRAVGGREWDDPKLLQPILALAAR